MRYNFVFVDKIDLPYYDALVFDSGSYLQQTWIILKSLIIFVWSLNYKTN